MLRYSLLMKNQLLLLFLLLGLSGAGMAQTDSGTKPEVTEKIKVFPNPAVNVINVLGLQNSREAFIRVSDLYGNTFLQHQWEIKNNALNIPIAHLEKGIYLIAIQTETYKFQTKFYKQ